MTSSSSGWRTELMRGQQRVALVAEQAGERGVDGHPLAGVGPWKSRTQTPIGACSKAARKRRSASRGRLEPVALGHVLGRAPDAAQLAVDALGRRAAAVHDALDAVGADQPVGDVERRAVERGAREDVADPVAVVGVDQRGVGRVAGGGRGRIDAEDPVEARAPGLRAGLQVGRPAAEVGHRLGLLEQRALAARLLLGLLQAQLVGLAGGDVARGGDGLDEHAVLVQDGGDGRLQPHLAAVARRWSSGS